MYPEGNQALSSFKINKPIEVNVLPGKHVLKVRHQRIAISWYGALPFQSMVAEGNLGLIVEAGKNYVIKASSKGYGVNFWIEEAGTGKVVSHGL
jgi:hypothetical protein